MFLNFCHKFYTLNVDEIFLFYPLSSTTYIQTMGMNPQSKTNNPKCKAVRFVLEASQTVSIPSYRAFSSTELENFRYTKDELKRIDIQNKKLQRLIESGDLSGDDSEDYSIRGIPTEEFKAKRAENLQQAKASVFSEQQRQYMAGSFNAKKIRKAFVKFTQPAMDEAIIRAEQDRRAVAVGSYRSNCSSITESCITHAAPKKTKMTIQQGASPSTMPSCLPSALACNVPINRSILSPRTADDFCNKKINMNDLVFMLDTALSVVEDSGR